jgi:plastocyanin
MSTPFATLSGALAIVAAVAVTAVAPASTAWAGTKPPPAKKAAPTAPAKAHDHKGKKVPPPPPPITTHVVQKFLAFNPTEMKIKPGDSVVWTNMETDDTTHSVVQGNGADIDSPDMPPKATFTWLFDAPGEWDIICRFHPDMHLTINVVGKALPGAKAHSHHMNAGPPAKDTDPTGSTVPGLPGLPIALEPPRRG